MRTDSWAGKPSLVAGVVLVLLAGCGKAVNSAADTGRTLLTVLILCAPGLVWTAVCRYRRDQAAAAQPNQGYRQALEAWQQHAAAHEQAQLAGMGRVDEWGSAEPPGLQTDVFGGSWWGWQALLTTHGTSILATGPLLVLDLSGQLVSGELTATAERYARGNAAQYVLPADLDRCGLLAACPGRSSPRRSPRPSTRAHPAGHAPTARSTSGSWVSSSPRWTATSPPRGWPPPSRPPLAIQSNRASLPHMNKP